VAAISPVDAGLPSARIAVTVRRDWTQKKNPGEEKSHTRFFLSSLSLDDPVRAAEAVRSHWGIENRNHHKKDTCAWREDDHRHRRPRAALNLALTRNALLAIIPFEHGQALARFFEHYDRHPAQALQLILHSRPFP
jgi:predicted transposase YbfD/YdcC